MSLHEKQAELERVLWNGADVLRSKMDANEYKNYLLGLIFYKYLSDKFLVEAYDLINDEKPEKIEDAQEAYEKICETDDIKKLLSELNDTLRYTIKPEHTYTKFSQKVASNKFQREQLQEAFNIIEQSDPMFEGIFADVDLYSTRLGNVDTKQSQTISELIRELDQADFMEAEGNILGNAYEYLIGQFASETGKKAGEFYSPAGPSEIVARTSILGQENKCGLTIYDACMGSGSLLLRVKNYANEPENISYYGQELMVSTYNLARMNMFLHGIAPENQHLHVGDTLDDDWPTTHETEFDMVCMNPPYSAKWSAVEGFAQDERFIDFNGNLAPKSKADYAFLLHGLYHLKNTGTMSIILPHGVLFRGASEGKIREQLLRNGNIYAVIGLPANLFYNTSIPTCIMVLKKHRDGRDVLFIDGSKLFVKGKKQNTMSQEHIDHIMELFTNRETVDKEAYLASFEDIQKNDFNLNIPRYVDNFEEEEVADLSELVLEMNKIDEDIAETQKDIVELMSQLSFNDKKDKSSIEQFLKILEG